MTAKKARCFVCERLLGSTYMAASFTAPTMCLRCGGRVYGLIQAALALAAGGRNKRTRVAKAKV